MNDPETQDAEGDGWDRAECGDQGELLPVVGKEIEEGLVEVQNGAAIWRRITICCLKHMGRGIDTDYCPANPLPLGVVASPRAVPAVFSSWRHFNRAGQGS